MISELTRKKGELFNYNYRKYFPTLSLRYSYIYKQV